MTTHSFVLLVEPDAILRELIHRELKNQGCIVFDAADPGEALAFAELYTGPIDLAVPDLPTTHHQDQLFTDALRSLPPRTHTKVLHMATLVDDPHRGAVTRRWKGPPPRAVLGNSVRGQLRNRVPVVDGTYRGSVRHLA
jgi:CheY-like chemotaxis protein